MTADLAAHCSRCGQPAPITADEQDDIDSGAITIAPDDWLEDDDGNLICPACATRREHIEWDAGQRTRRGKRWPAGIA